MHYLGGKARIAGDVAGYLNAVRALSPRPYWEPMVGAGWVLCRIKGQPNYASDAHPSLIAMWRALQGGWRPPTVVTEGDYEAARGLSDDDPLKGFIGFGCS
jgi:DNA adenine methylase